MMMMLKFVEHKFLRAKIEQQPSRGKAYEHDLFHSTWRKTLFYDKNSWTLVWAWFLANSEFVVFLSFAILLKRIFIKNSG